MAGGSDIRAGAAFVELYMRDSAFTRGLKVAEGQIKDWGGRVGKAIAAIPKDLGASISAVGTKLMGLGTAIAVPLGASVNAFASLQSELAKLQAAANPTARQMDLIRQSVLGISKATGQGPANVAAAFTELIKAGTSAETALGGAAEAVVKFAKVSGMDAAESAVIVSDMLNVFAKEGLSAAQATDILSQAADASSVDLKQMAWAFSMSSAIAGSTGVSLRDLSAAIGILGKAGLKGSDAGTALKTMLLRLAAPTDDAAKAMKQYGVEARDAEGNVKTIRDIIVELQAKLGGLDSASRDNALREIFGTDAIRPALILLQQGTAGWDSFVDGMSSANSVAAKFDIMMNTTAGDIERMWASVQRAGAAIGEALAGPLTQFAKWVEETAGSLGKWASANQEAIVSLAKLAAGAVAFGIAAKVLGPVVNAARLLGTVLTKLPAAISAVKLFAIAHPAVAATGAIVGLMAAIFPWKAVMTALSGSTLKAADATSTYSSSSKDLTAATKAEHAAAMAMLQRLEELREKHSGTSMAMEEAKSIIAELSARYPALADAIGKVGTSAEATGKAIAGMNKALADSLTEDERLRKIGDLQEKRTQALNELQAIDQQPGNAARSRIEQMGGGKAAEQRISDLRGEAFAYSRRDPERSTRARAEADRLEHDLRLAVPKTAAELIAALRHEARMYSDNGRAAIGEAQKGNVERFFGKANAKDFAEQLEKHLPKPDAARAKAAAAEADRLEKLLKEGGPKAVEADAANRRAAASKRVDDIQNQIDAEITKQRALELRRWADANEKEFPNRAKEARAEADRIEGKLVKPYENSPRKLTQLEQRAQREGRDAQIDAMKDGLEKELAQVNAKYDDMLKEATKAEEQWSIEIARMAALKAAREKHNREVADAQKKKLDAIKKDADNSIQSSLLSQIENEHEREIAEIRGKYAEKIKAATTEWERKALTEAMGREIDAAGKAYGKRQADMNRDLDDEVRRLSIERTLFGRDRENALIEMDREKALREAAKTGADVGRINELFDLKRMMAGRVSAADVYGNMGSGTFSAQGAALMGQGSAAEQTAKNTRDTATHLSKVLRKLDKANLVMK
jgi:TP901 family phage tail tape measure protein